MRYPLLIKLVGQLDSAATARLVNEIDRIRLARGGSRLVLPAIIALAPRLEAGKASTVAAQLAREIDESSRIEDVAELGIALATLFSAN